MPDIKQTIHDTVKDLVSHLLCYDRKEDEELPVGAIEEAIASGVITKAEIMYMFRNELNHNLTEGGRPGV